jgi:flavin reductase (DIM6/NTAB) family NADH-FMN oxidoreductase RutF
MSAGESREEQKLFRQIMGRFATGITVITTVLDDAVFGMTANAFMAGSLVPPLCVISIGCNAQMHERLKASRRFGVSFLNEEQQHLSGHFAGRIFEGLEPDFAEIDGMPVLNRAVATLAADVVSTAACGDHTLFIGQISHMKLGSGMPLLFHGGRYATVRRAEGAEEIEAPAFW